MNNTTPRKLLLIAALAVLSISSTFAQPFNALNFDGVNDNVSINNTLGNFAADFTIEMEIKPGGDVSGIVAKKSVCASTNYFSLNATTTPPFFIFPEALNTSFLAKHTRSWYRRLLAQWATAP